MGAWGWSKRRDDYRKMREAIVQAEAARKAAAVSPPTGAVGATGPAPALISASTSYITSAPITFDVFPSDPPALNDLGLAIEPIVGLRSFGIYMDGNDPVLTSFNGTPWPAYEALYATCGSKVISDHDSPSISCQCGIYAWNQEVGARNRGGEGSVWGDVYLWGDVLIADAGYRAEIAYPKSLHIESQPTRSAIRVRDGLADMYGVPVTLGTEKGAA